MKKVVKLFAILLVTVIAIPVITGCEPKRKDVKFNGEEGTITFSVKENENYKISTKDKDLRTSREQGVLIADNFKIGIEFDDNFEYFFNSDFNKLKEARKDYDEYKEVTYSGIKGIQYFYGSYNCYNILLPVKGDKEHFLVLSVYGKKDTEKAAKEAIKLDEVKDVLDHITFSGKKK